MGDRFKHCLTFFASLGPNHLRRTNRLRIQGICVFRRVSPKLLLLSVRVREGREEGIGGQRMPGGKVLCGGCRAPRERFTFSPASGIEPKSLKPKGHTCSCSEYNALRLSAGKVHGAYRWPETTRLVSKSISVPVMALGVSFRHAGASCTCLQCPLCSSYFKGACAYEGSCIWIKFFRPSMLPHGGH